jgi:hypothetical protein
LNLDVLPALLRGFAGFETSPASPYREPWLQALNLDVLPALLRGFAGFETSPASPYRAPWLQALNLDVLPNLLRGFAGWEPSPAPQYREPWLQALNLDVLPALLQGFAGFEASPASPYRAPWLQALNLDVLPNLLQGFAGWEPSPTPQYRAPWLQALDLDVLPNLLQGFAGWETSPAPQYRAPWLQALNLDVLPNLLRGFAGWEPSPTPQYRSPWLQALNLDVLPALLRGFAGWEPSPTPQYRSPWLQALNLDVLPNFFQSATGWESGPSLQRVVTHLKPSTFDTIFSGFRQLVPWGFLPETPRPYQVPFLKIGYEDLFPEPSNVSHIEVEPALPPQYRIPPLQALNLDVLPNVQLQVIYPYSPDLPTTSARAHSQLWIPTDDYFTNLLFPYTPGTPDVAVRIDHPLWTPPDDYWPPIIVPPTPSRLGVGGGEYVCETEEDINRRECLEKTIQAIDGELAELERKSRQDGVKIVEPEIMPPDWKAGDDDNDDNGYWYDPRDPRTYGRPVRPRQEDRTGRGYARQVHYNFASDMDFGVRRRIIGILDRAEHRGARIYGSDAFVTQREAKVHGTLVVPGTNAWVLKLGAEERLAVAREAIAEGFRLVSFDDTSLSFIHRQTYPWKTLFLGASVGATIMGAGVYTGYLIWGRSTPPPPTQQLSAPKPRSIIKKPGRKPRK